MTDTQSPPTSGKPPGTLRACMTVDWEDFGQLNCLYHLNSVPEPNRDIERQTDIILELLSETGVHATFFVLGMLARERPDLVRRIHSDGHEISLHGMNHIHLTRLNRSEFKSELEESIDRVTDIIGGPVYGFRAPFFSVLRGNLYVLDVLAKAGIEYDSSVFPKAMPRYGIAGFDPEPRHYQLPEGGRIVELPLTVLPWGGIDWPVSGGGYTRLMPKLLLNPLVKKLSKLHRPFVFYTHPYEFDSQRIDVASGFPAGKAFPPLKRAALNFKWNLFRRSFLDKSRHLLENLNFSTCKELSDEIKRDQCTRLLG